jgi:hypothetical protein
MTLEKNCLKTKCKLARYKIITDIGKDYLDKASSVISNNYAIVVVKDLRIKNIPKPALRTLEGATSRLS